ncbi:recombinase family protein [Priestia aryabhattai]|nr:recombinase family protein [Priestia aryabhattai]
MNIISNTHEAIISRDMFNAIQNQMKQRKTRHLSPVSVNDKTLIIYKIL